LTIEKRRPIKSRDHSLAKSTARFLANAGISPNMVSVLSSIFSIFGFICFYQAWQRQAPLYLLFAALFVQLRLLCNLFDGMIAVEYNKASPTGEIYNDLPDRISDAFFIIGAGYFCQDQYLAIHIAWLTTVFAILTAYIRVLGLSMGAPVFFSGPMAKPHRMFLLTIAAVIQAFLIWGGKDIAILYYALIVMMLGSFLTCVRRLGKISKFLNGEKNG